MGGEKGLGSQQTDGEGDNKNTLGGWPQEKSHDRLSQDGCIRGQSNAGSVQFLRLF